MFVGIKKQNRKEGVNNIVFANRNSEKLDYSVENSVRVKSNLLDVDLY